MYKSFKNRLDLTVEQESLFGRVDGCCRKVYNHFLAYRNKMYDKHGLVYTLNDYSKNLSWMKSDPETSYLKEPDSTILQQKLRDLDKAYKNYFESKAGKRAGDEVGLPKFKSKHGSRKSFRVANVTVSIRIQDGKLRLGKLGFFKVCNSKKRFKQFESYKIVSATVSKDSDGHWYVSVLCEVDENQVKNHVVTNTNRVNGLDLGVKTSVKDSYNIDFNIPERVFKLKAKLAKEQEKLSRMRGPKRKKNILPSFRYRRQKLKVGKLHFKIKSIRKDWQHKLAIQLIKDYDIIVMETLDIQAMSEATGEHKKDFNDEVLTNAWYQLKTFIKYKAEWYGKSLIEVDKYFPSTKLCSHCGRKNAITISMREYICGGCNTHHDRDHNAAKNLWLVGWYYQLTGKVLDTYKDLLITVIPAAKTAGII